MATYQVFYVLKKNKREEINHMFISANNQREAITKCKEVVLVKTGRNAFRATTKVPYKIGRNAWGEPIWKM